MNNVVKIGKAATVEGILNSLNDRDDTEELYVLRAYRNENGVRHLEWWTTECDSRIWSVGALHYVAHKIMESSDDD